MSSDSHNLIDREVERLERGIAQMEAEFNQYPPHRQRGSVLALKDTIDTMRERLRQWQDLQVAFGCAVELAIHVDRAAKGTLLAEAKKVLSTPHAQQMREKLFSEGAGAADKQRSMQFNRITWRMLELTGKVPPGADTVVANPEQTADDFIDSWNRLQVAVCQAVALLNMTPMEDPRLHQAHDILRLALLPGDKA